MLPKFLKNKNITPDNLNLLYNKFYKEEDYKGQSKERFYREFIDAAYNTNNKEKIKTCLEACKKRIVDILLNFKNKDYCVHQFTLKTDWRLVVGLGGTNVLETSLSLHPLYGFPYIPSSSVKGVARAAALFIDKKFVDEEDKTINNEINDDAKPDMTAQFVFGTKESVGNALFFDALPDKVDIFDIDTMTNHYEDYYNKKEKSPPADWYSPNPIKFVTIKPGTNFNFYVVSKECLLKERHSNASNWLIKGLNDIGVGAKTSSGYGYFYQ